MADIPEGLEPQQLLSVGVEKGHKKWVEHALASGANPHVILPKDHPLVSRGSMMLLAAGRGHEHLIPVLLDAGVHIDDDGMFGYTPLQVATHLGNDKVVDVLLAQSEPPDVNAKDKEGVTSLHLAARKDREYCAKALIAAGADLNARDRKQRTPLHVSVFGSSTRIMKLLLEAGSDVHALNDMGFSVLHIAALCGNESAVQELRMAGLEGDEKDATGLTPEEVAETWGSHSTAWLLRKMPRASRLPRSTAPSASCQNMLRRSWSEYEDEGQKTLQWVKDDLSYILEANTPLNRDPHYQDANGWTPMHWAAHLGFTLTVRALSKSCASYIKAVNYAGDTPAQLAARAGHTSLAQEILSMVEKDTESPEELYWQLLITISAKDDTARAVTLLTSGAPLEATENLHSDALVLAINCNRPRIVTLLAAAGASLATNSGGLSLLQMAWLSPDVTVRVKVLVTRLFLNALQAEQNRIRSEDSVLRNGIDNLLTSLRGATPWLTCWPYREKDYSDLTNLMVAAARNNCPLTGNFLRLCGAMAFNKNDQGTTPLHAALKANHLGMAKSIVKDLGGSLYVADSKGKFPVSLLPWDTRQQLQEKVYHRERHHIENCQEKAKDQESKKYLQDVLDVFETLFAKHMGRSSDTPSEVPLTQALLVASRRGLQLLTYLVIMVGGLPVNTVVDPTQESTCLHQAASHGHSVCVALLLGLSACALQPDRYGHTSAHLAAMFCHKLTYKLLRKNMNQQSPLNRAGKTHQQVARSFKSYMKCYGKNNVAPLRSLRFNDPSLAIKEVLKESNFRKKMKNVKNIAVDFSQGEAKEVKEVVLKEVGNLVAEVAAQNSLYQGRLTLVGSGADGTRLFAPDEFDINLVVSGADDVEVNIEELGDQEALLKGHTLKVQVKANHPDLQGNAFKSNFYQLMGNCLVTHTACDTRISYVPPGLEKTQAGVALNLAWQGEAFPLLLISIDVVPVVSVTWPKRLKRPPLTPSSVTEVFLTNMEDGEWRFSLAGAEAELLRSLVWEDRQVYLSCKLLLSHLKAERWMPQTVKAAYSWWDSRKWRITKPDGFGVKNSFFRMLERKQVGEFEWPHKRSAAIATIFRDMCDDFRDPSTDLESLVPVKVHAYFGGEFEKPKFGEGAPDIIKVLEDEDERGRA